MSNDLVDRLQADTQLGRFWQHRGEDGMKRERQLLVDFLCAAAGGPMYYTGPSIIVRQHPLDCIHLSCVLSTP